MKVFQILQEISDLADYCRSHGLELDAERLDRIRALGEIEAKGQASFAKHVASCVPNKVASRILPAPGAC